MAKVTTQRGYDNADIMNTLNDKDMGFIEIFRYTSNGVDFPDVDVTPLNLDVGTLMLRNITPTEPDSNVSFMFTNKRNAQNVNISATSPYFNSTSLTGGKTGYCWTHTEIGITPTTEVQLMGTIRNFNYRRNVVSISKPDDSNYLRVYEYIFLCRGNTQFTVLFKQLVALN